MGEKKALLFNIYKNLACMMVLGSEPRYFLKAARFAVSGVRIRNHRAAKFKSPGTLQNASGAANVSASVRKTPFQKAKMSF